MRLGADHASGAGGVAMRGQSSTFVTVVVAGLLSVSSVPIAATAATAAPAAAPKAAEPCAGAEFHQFDFFAGDWDAFDPDAPAHPVARNHVTPILGGCVLHEVHAQDDGLVGESFSMYDAPRGVWHESWVTKHGRWLVMDGHLQGDRMIFTGEWKTSSKSATVRVVWIAQGKAVRETAEGSSDGGKTWTPMFDLIFRPHAPKAGE